MEKRAIIYTYGKEQIEATQLLNILKPYRINCVVDCRPYISTSNTYLSSTQQLSDILKSHNISYIPFYKHFGLLSTTVLTKRGKPIYAKVTQTDYFQEGVKRIRNGIAKGFTICIIDGKQDTATSFRHTIIGQYLKDFYQITHIYSAIQTLSYEELSHRIEEHNAITKQKKLQSQKTGKAGEEIAGLYLINKGYQILDLNWNLHKGCELDIVATKDNKLHFIEVKTRSSDKYGEPQIAIDKKKMKHILSAIHEYRYKKYLFNMEYQIDSIAIIYRGEHDYDLKHFTDIRPDYYTPRY